MVSTVQNIFPIYSTGTGHSQSSRYISPASVLFFNHPLNGTRTPIMAHIHSLSPSLIIPHAPLSNTLVPLTLVPLTLVPPTLHPSPAPPRQHHRPPHSFPSPPSPDLLASPLALSHSAVASSRLIPAVTRLSALNSLDRTRPSLRTCRLWGGRLRIHDRIPPHPRLPRIHSQACGQSRSFCSPRHPRVASSFRLATHHLAARLLL